MGFLSHGAPPEMGGRGRGRRAGDLRGCDSDLGSVERSLVANVVQLQSYNFICLLQAACLVQAVCFSTALFGNGPKSAFILSGAGRLRTATSTDDQALSQVDPGSLLCRVDNRITARVRCRLN